jgi:hypothetical protein
LSLQLEGGKLAEFFDAASKHKLSVVIADRLSTREGVLPEDLMRELDLERLGKSDYQRVERVILRYGAAQFNVLAAGNVAPTLVPVAGRDITAQRFTTTRGANFLMGILEGREGQVFFLALRKGEPVDAVFIGQLLSAMPAARGDVSAQIEAGS